MSINATASSVNSSASVTSSSASTEVSKKTSEDSSFKDEMNKVAESEKTNDKDKTEKTEVKVEDNVSNNEESNEISNITEKQDSVEYNTNDDYSKFASMAMIDVNSMLSNDIEQMNNIVSASGLEVSEGSKVSSMLFLDFTDNISVSKSDAEFFMNLTKNNDVSVQNITVQAQTMLNQGADVREVQQNVRISETLLNAINNAKETNQPLRIDFDQNVSVILRIGKDGTIAANFIPGDKAVEQYLKNNIESLKNTFNENDLPYSDLSYSNRGSKHQKERRNNQK